MSTSAAVLWSFLVLAGQTQVPHIEAPVPRPAASESSGDGLQARVQEARLEWATALLDAARALDEDYAGDSVDAALRLAAGAVRTWLDIYPDTPQAEELGLDIAALYLHRLNDAGAAADLFTRIRDRECEASTPRCEELAREVLRLREEWIFARSGADAEDIPRKLFAPEPRGTLGTRVRLIEGDIMSPVTVTPAPIPPSVQAWLTDADRYLQLGLHPPASERYVGRVAFFLAKIHLRYGYLAAAELRLRALSEARSDDEVLMEHIRSALVEISDLRNDASARARLETILREPIDFSQIHVTEDPRFRFNQRLRRVQSKLEAAEDLGEGPEQWGRVRELQTDAAQELLRIIEENPDLERMDTLLMCAARCFDDAQRFYDASRLYERIVNEERFEGSEFQERALTGLARCTELTLDFAAAQRLYRRLVRDFPESDHAEWALLSVAKLQEFDSNQAAVCETLEEFLGRFPTSKAAPKVRRYLEQLRGDPDAEPMAPKPPEWWYEAPATLD